MIIDLAFGPQLKSTTQYLMRLMHTRCGWLALPIHYQTYSIKANMHKVYVWWLELGKGETIN